MIAVGQEQQLGRKAFLLFLAKKTIVAVVLILAAFFLAVLGPYIALGMSGAVAIGTAANSGTESAISGGIAYISTFLFLLGVIVFLIGFIVSLLQYRNYVFTLDEFDLKLRRGIFSQKETSIPYRQIQDVDIVRSLAYRIMGLSRLVMMTAGHDDPGIHDQTDTAFDPIDKELAEEVRSFLERKIGVQITESTVKADTEEKIEEKK